MYTSRSDTDKILQYMNQTYPFSQKPTWREIFPERDIACVAIPL